MMAYSEQYRWCSSSILTTLHPSHVDKSTQPCPVLSLSRTSTSSSSVSYTNNQCIRIGATDTISALSRSAKEEKATYAPLPCLEQQQQSSSNDYYARRRIEQLHDRMDDIQISNFLKFINHHLSSFKHDRHPVKDLTHDLANGHVLLDLIEIFSSTKLKREHGRTRFHSLTNVQYVLDYLKLHMQHVNISPHEIVSGNRKQILALLWIIMKIFDFPSFRIATNKHLFHENTLFTYGQDRGVLLKWINHLLNTMLKSNLTHVRDLYLQTWIDNAYLSLIMKSLGTLSSKYGTATCLEFFKQLDDVDLSKQQRFEQCLNFSTYAFDIHPMIDFTDHTEKSLLRFFSDLHQRIVHITKSQDIGKMSKLNQYTRHIFEAVLETTITGNVDDGYRTFIVRFSLLAPVEHSPVDDESEDYVIFVQSEQPWLDEKDAPRYAHTPEEGQRMPRTRLFSGLQCVARARP